MSGRVAFFDLDRTVISRNSATLWIRHELSARRIGWRQATRALTWVVRYNLGAVDLEAQIREAVVSLAGIEEGVIRERTERFYASAVRALYRPGARAAIEAHRRAGDRVVLLTSVSTYLAAAVGRELDLDDYVANRFEVDAEGRFTGMLCEPICFGPGKVALARRWVERCGSSMADSVFYSDSYSDLPMLAATGRPVAVHPDPQLRRVARQRGWEVVDWGVP